MKTGIFINGEQLVTKAIDMLIKGLGPVETNRFLSLIKKDALNLLSDINYGR